MEITTEMIKSLRESTGAGILDCRKALEQSNGDMNAALDFLREKGLATATKRAARTASEGIVELYNHGDGRVGVMVEVNCETDFVGRSEAFRTLAHEIALQIAATSPEYVLETDIPESVIDRETKIATAKAKEEGKPEAILPRIVEGALKKYKNEFVLMLQPYIRDESITVQELINQNVAALGENIVVRRFARWALGETSAEESES
ncbi:MAG TPA: translation elongation factor Ts [Anaerolineaceae bacterium]|jgi:elongation factor Ts|nr:translation elongation factor Ts [Anaerolineaceae bacterium]NMC17191.1 translation elongation factor Ts [Chloroflexota bacterium]HNS07337.1 translation elongation factor Ts [Anaerolineaceae bacterium]HNW13166.1 translation elongation factor Ts [Anaerolineaceae bacterium]HOE01733.1 translation elongation factor Ts [Anaerolineaceae bacterium]